MNRLIPPAMLDDERMPLAYREKRLELETIRFYRQIFLSRTALLDGGRALRDHASSDLIMRCVSEMAGRKTTISKRQEIAVPTDWWQHFKARWFPRWALARWPVKQTVHVLLLEAKASALFPEVEPFQAHRLVICAFDGEGDYRDV